jgi:hypothetical protein
MTKELLLIGLQSHPGELTHHITNYSLSLITYHLPLTTYHLPLTTYHLPLTTYHFSHSQPQLPPSSKDLVQLNPYSFVTTYNHQAVQFLETTIIPAFKRIQAKDLVRMITSYLEKISAILLHVATQHRTILER